MPTVNDPRFQEKIVGLLGSPLGKIVTVEGRIVKVASKNPETPDLQLEVASIDKVPLSKPVTIRYSPAVRLDIEVKFDSNVEFVGFESGGFVGLPKGSFNVIQGPAPASYGFSWWPEFKVLKQLK
jgi:hypothetical protein